MSPTFGRPWMSDNDYSNDSDEVEVAAGFEFQPMENVLLTLQGVQEPYAQLYGIHKRHVLVQGDVLEHFERKVL